MAEELIIQVQKRPLDNFGHPLFFLTEAAGKLNLQPCPSAVFDFSKCRFVHPFVLCGIATFQAQLLKRNIQCTLTGLNNPSLAGYFSAIGFPEGMQISASGNTSGYYNKTYFPFTVFPAQKGNEAKKDACIDALGNIIRRQCNLSTNLFQAFQYFVSELTQNITDHSGSEKGYIFAQYYPSKMYLDICIADTGAGLLQTYLQSGRHHPQNHQEAMNLALTGFSTKDLPESRGFGISTTRKMLINGLGGKFFIWSGNAVAYQNNEKLDVIALKPGQLFGGVFIALRVPVSSGNQFDLYNYIT
jgi:anti-sigma regulatory factor (Ser/Thr protein kinase)